MPNNLPDNIREENLIKILKQEEFNRNKITEMHEVIITQKNKLAEQQQNIIEKIEGELSKLEEKIEFNEEDETILSELMKEIKNAKEYLIKINADLLYLRINYQRQMYKWKFKIDGLKYQIQQLTRTIDLDCIDIID